MKAQKLNHRQAQQTLYLSRFDFTLKHVPETRMGKVGRLSRQSNWKVGVEKDNKNQVIIKDSQVRKLEGIIIEGLEIEVIEKIKKVRSKDEEVVVIATTCWNSTCSMLTSAKLTEDYLVVGIIRELDKEPLLY